MEKYSSVGEKQTKRKTNKQTKQTLSPSTPHKQNDCPNFSLKLLLPLIRVCFFLYISFSSLPNSIYLDLLGNFSSLSLFLFPPPHLCLNGETKIYPNNLINLLDRQQQKFPPKKKKKCFVLVLDYLEPCALCKRKDTEFLCVWGNQSDYEMN